MQYVIVHHHPENLVLNPRQRDILFSSGNLLALVESAVAVLQEKHFGHVINRPLGLILWGVEDHHGVAPPDVEVFPASRWHDCHELCCNRRPCATGWATEDGRVVRYREWNPGPAA